MRAAGYLAALLLACALAVVLLRAYSRWVTFPGSPLRLREEAGVEVVRYSAEDGVALESAWVPSSQVGAPALVYFHGNAEAAAHNVPLARLLAQRGIHVLLAEYRGYGGCPGKPTEAGLLLDGEAARKAVAALGVPPSRQALCGRSLGTAVATQLAVREAPAHLVLVSPFTSAVDVGRSLVGPLAPFLVADRFDSLGSVKSLTCPVTIVHGTVDEVIPFRMGEAMAGAIPGSTLLPVRGRGHNDLPLEQLAQVIATEILKSDGSAGATPDVR